MKVVSGIGIQYASQFLTKIIKAASKSTNQIQSQKGKFNVWDIVAKNIFEMSS